MEDTFTFLENEIVSQEFTDKLNDNYSIKEIKFELDHEITNIYTKYNNWNISINDTIIGVIDEYIEYYNNILTIKINPFYDKKHIPKFDIKIYRYVFNNISHMHEINYTSFKKCIIIIKEIFFQCNYNRYDREKEGYFCISSNYFNNMIEFKNYFINWTNSNEDIYEQWFNKCFKWSWYLSIDSKNNNFDRIILLEQECKKYLKDN